MITAGTGEAGEQQGGKDGKTRGQDTRKLRGKYRKEEILKASFA